MKTEDIEVLGRELNQARSQPDTVDRPVRTARIVVHHYNSTQYCKTETVLSMFPFLQTNITSDTSYWAKTHNARLPERPTKKHVELVANSETGNTGLKKGPGLHALHGLCATVRCAPLEIIVPRQEEISGATTGIRSN